MVFSTYFGIYKALWYGLNEILHSLCEHLIKIGGEVDAKFQNLAQDISQSVKNVKNESELQNFIDINMKFADKNES